MINTTEPGPAHALPPWQYLSKGTQFWWRVQASTDLTTSAWSTVFTFITPTDPPAPVLTTPLDWATVTTPRPTMAWAAVPGATSYQIQVSTNSWFGTRVVDAVVTGATSYTPTVDLAVAAYAYWRVRATNGAGTGPWAVTQSFYVP